MGFILKNDRSRNTLWKPSNGMEVSCQKYVSIYDDTLKTLAGRCRMWDVTCGIKGGGTTKVMVVWTRSKPTTGYTVITLITESQVFLSFPPLHSDRISSMSFYAPCAVKRSAQPNSWLITLRQTREGDCHRRGDSGGNTDEQQMEWREGGEWGWTCVYQRRTEREY